jgi:protocatechuate 3,4-dioxygenase beta subunit
MRSLAFAVFLSAAGACSAAEAPPVRANLYQCEGCEAALERDPQTLGASADLAGPDEPGERLILRGVVYAADGATPAQDIVIYAHHTNAEGLYANGSDESELSRLHGRLRGWVKTGADGRYEFRTVKPAPYPTRTDPAHIHLTILEPGQAPYWIDEVVFASEFGVTSAWAARRENRGGSGIVTLARDGEAWLATRNIVLERHPK